MTTTARNLLDTFETLAPTEKQQVAAEILRRSAGANGLPDQALDELAAEVFGGYDAEESAGGSR